MTQFSAQSVVDVDEGELCRWLFAQPFLSAELWRKLGLAASCRVKFDAETRQILPQARGPGDIDILAGDPDRPEETTVIEAKRVKISELTFTNLAPTKLDSCAKGVIQANHLGTLGFHRAWLLVVVATDGRERPGVNFVSRGITWELMDIIHGHPAFASLAAGVGLVFVYLDQPLDKGISCAGGVGFSVRREPTLCGQSLAVTAAVRDLWAKPLPYTDD